MISTEMQISYVVLTDRCGPSACWCRMHVIHKSLNVRSKAYQVSNRDLCDRRDSCNRAAKLADNWVVRCFSPCRMSLHERPRAKSTWETQNSIFWGWQSFAEHRVGQHLHENVKNQDLDMTNFHFGSAEYTVHCWHKCDVPLLLLIQVSQPMPRCW